MKKTILFSLAMVVCACVFTGCTKQVPGPEGDAGTPGKPGNMKKTDFNPIKISPASWVLKEQEWESVIYISGITKQVIDKGEVQAYIKQHDRWQALPYGEGFIFTQYSIVENRIRLHHAHVHGGVPDRPEETTLRLVILEPAQ